MTTITISLPDTQLEIITKRAQDLGISPEVFLQVSIEDWLTHPRKEFTEAADYVLKKNAELYKRLA
jgi:hypothetical protein